MLLFRQPRMRFGRAGVLQADLSTAGGSVSPLANDLPSLAGRASAQWLWTLLTPLPGGVTTEVRDDGYYGLVSPPDGTYTQVYRGLVMPSSGAPQVYTATITTTVGAGAPSYIGAAASMSAAASLSAASGIYTAASGPASYVGVAASMSAAASLLAASGIYTAASGPASYVGVAAALSASPSLSAVAGIYYAPGSSLPPGTALSCYTVRAVIKGGKRMTEVMTNPGFSAKDPDERVAVAFDFAGLCATVTSPTVTSSLHAGTADPDAASVWDGAAGTNGAEVLRWMVGGVDGADYYLRCEATGSDGGRYVLAGVLPVRAA